MKNIAIFGAGGFGREVKWLIDEINKKSNTWNFLGYFDDDFTNSINIPDGQRLGNMDTLNKWPEPLSLVFALGSPEIKKKVILKVENDQFSFPALIHPSVFIGNNVEIGEGCIICAGCIITVDIKIGKHVILNLGCTIGHDSIIGNYSSFMPSVNLFYVQRQKEVGNFPQLDAFLNIQIQRVRIFVLFEHLNQNVLGFTTATYITPHYPVMNRALRFGVTWSFYN